jgi:hypothetical protein
MTEKDHVHEWTVFADGDDVHAACVFPLCHARLLESEIADRLNWYSVEFETPSIPIDELGKLLGEALLPSLESLIKSLRDMQRTLDNPKR